MSRRIRTDSLMQAIMTAVDRSEAGLLREHFSGLPNDKGKVATDQEIWVAVVKLWNANYLMVSNDCLPFVYALSEHGQKVLSEVREGESLDKQNAALERLCTEYGDVRTYNDPSPTKRILAVPVCTDGKLLNDEARWIYQSGYVARADIGECNALIAEEAAA